MVTTTDPRTPEASGDFFLKKNLSNLGKDMLVLKFMSYLILTLKSNMLNRHTNFACGDQALVVSTYLRRFLQFIGNEEFNVHVPPARIGFQPFYICEKHGICGLSKPKVLDFQRNPTEKLELCPWIYPPFFVADFGETTFGGDSFRQLKSAMKKPWLFRLYRASYYPIMLGL